MSKLKYVVAHLAILLISTGVNAAYIDTLNGPPSAFHIEREAKKLKKIAPFKPLQVGDKITIRKPTHEIDHISDKENFITLALDEGVFKTLKYADTQEKPYTVTAAPNSPNVANGAMNLISAWVYRLWKNDIQIVDFQIQGGEPTTRPISMRLLKGNNAQLIVGYRELHLAWYGGKPPYQIQVSKIGTKIVCWDEKNIATAEITLKKRKIKAGRFQVVVSDAQSKKVFGKFTAAEAPSLLQNSEARAIEQSDLPKSSKETLLAAWLAKQGGWYFEAYQRIAPITGYYPAQLVKQGLERGKRPK